MLGEGAELVALGLVQIGGVRFFEEQKKVKDVFIGQIQVDDARASAFPPAWQCHPSFSQTPATDKEIALLRIFEQFILKSPEIRIINAVGQLAGKQRVSMNVSVTEKGYNVVYLSQCVFAAQSCQRIRRNR